MWSPYRPSQALIADRPLQQSSVYADAVCAIGGSVAVNWVQDQPILALEHGPFRLALRCRGTAKDLKQIARGKALIALPETGFSGWGFLPMAAQRQVALWDLTPSPETLRERLHQKWRNRLNQAEQIKTAPERGGTRCLERLLARESVQRSNRGYRSLPQAFSQAIPSRVLQLWHWSPGSNFQAGMAFIRHGSWATYHIGYASAEARAANIHQRMLWHAAMTLRSEGVTTLDLGDINQKAAPGIARFKLGTGARIHELGRTCWVMPQLAHALTRHAVPVRER